MHRRPALLLALLVGAVLPPAPASAVQVVENEFFTATLPSRWEIRPNRPESKTYGSLFATAAREGSLHLSVMPLGRRTTLDTAFMRRYESLHNRSPVEHEESINQASHRTGIGVKLVTRMSRHPNDGVTIFRLLVFEESGRICSVQASVTGRTREEAEKLYAKFIPQWEDVVGALAIHAAPAGAPGRK